MTVRKVAPGSDRATADDIERDISKHGQDPMCRHESVDGRAVPDQRLERDQPRPKAK